MPNVSSPRNKCWRKASAWGAAATAAVAVVQLAGVTSALADAANPDPGTQITAVRTSTGVKVTVGGGWSWPGQCCEGRYGEGRAVDRWPITSSPRPTNNFA
jgi:hypothetical protein